jgi:NAD(P)-dependent dehydrogenase (short-subunit alcohol dehydrogenase family)
MVQTAPLIGVDRPTRARFNGQVAVVTGAGQGLGRAIAVAFASEGATVVLAARSADKLGAVAEEITSAGGSALSVPTDLREPDSVAALARTVKDEFGAADVLINNSGIAGPTALLWEQTLEDWEETVRVNLTGVFLCCRVFLPEMVQRKSGTVVVIGSMTGKHPLYARTPYAASKMGLIGLVRTLAWETGPVGIRVNLVSPGPIAGPRFDSVVAAQADARGIAPEQARTAFTSKTPLERVADAREIAAAVLFLASDEASTITGEDLNVSVGSAMYG